MDNYDRQDYEYDEIPNPFRAYQRDRATLSHRTQEHIPPPKEEETYGYREAPQSKPFSQASGKKGDALFLFMVLKILMEEED